MCYDIEFSCISNIGNVRRINQDNFICNNQYIKEGNLQREIKMSGNNNSKRYTLFGIFDGMGGEERGEVASYIAAKEAYHINYQKDSCFTLENYCKEANKKICKYAKENNVFAMGTTAAMLLFYKDEVTLCNIGDSKIFHFTNSNIK